MRPVPESIGKFTSREVFLLNCIRDLEERLAKVETVLRMDNEVLAHALRPAALCTERAHVFIGQDRLCMCGRMASTLEATAPLRAH